MFGRHERLHAVRRDIRDPGPLGALVGDVRPEEMYNLAGESSVGASFADPRATWESNAHVVVHLLDTMRNDSPETRFYQASSGEMFGSVPGESVVHDETAPLNPQSPYAAAKAAAHMLCHSYRESYGIRIACGILFNHESRRRGPQFLSRKVVDHVRALRAGAGAGPLALGNLKAQRDWGFAPDYVEGMVAILRQAAVRGVPTRRARTATTCSGRGGCTTSGSSPTGRSPSRASSSPGSWTATIRSSGRRRSQSPVSRRSSSIPRSSVRPTRRRSQPIRPASRRSSAGSRARPRRLPRGHARGRQRPEDGQAINARRSLKRCLTPGRGPRRQAGAQGRDRLRRTLGEATGVSPQRKRLSHSARPLRRSRHPFDDRVRERARASFSHFCRRSCHGFKAVSDTGTWP